MTRRILMMIKFELNIDLCRAREIRLDVPWALLVRADKVR